MTLAMMSSIQRFHPSDPFDQTVSAFGSNTRTQEGTFRMEVRHIVCNLMDVGGHRSVTLGVEGRRYKPDGQLGRVRVYAPVGVFQLPAEIRIAIWEWLPKEVTGW